MLILSSLLLAPVVIAVLLATIGFVMRHRPWRNIPTYKLAEFIPENVNVKRLKIKEGSQATAEVLVLTKGQQDENTETVIFVPGFSEDYRLGVLQFQHWFNTRNDLKLIVLLKRGYADPFVDSEIETEDYSHTFSQLGSQYTIHEDAEIVRHLVLNEGSKNLTLWGHSQGGATVQVVVTKDTENGYSVNEDIVSRLNALVLEASVLPDSGFSFLVGIIPFKFLAYGVIPLIPMTLRIKPFALIGPAMDRLYNSGLPDSKQRLTVYDRNMLRFKTPTVAVDNAFSLKRFVAQVGRKAILRELFQRGKLYGLFPRTEDLILDTFNNRRVMCEVAELPIETTTETGPIKIVEQTHCVGLENPRLVADLMQDIRNA